MKILVLVLSFCLLSYAAFAAIHTEAVEYKQGDVVLEGYLAYEEASPDKKPGIIVAHEWKGLGDYAKMRAEKLAELGYIAFAADMYGKGIFAKDHQEAAALAGAVRKDRNLMRERAKSALEVLKNHPLVDSNRLAAIGYCFGGTTVLEMARAGFELKGVVSFHGSLSTPVPAKTGEVKAKVLVMHGGEDPHISAEELNTFEAEMRQAQVNWQVVVFGGAYHSFTVEEAGSDPSSGAAYNEQADHRSWEMMQAFFNEIFSLNS